MIIEHFSLGRCLDVGSQSFGQTSEGCRELFNGDVQGEIGRLRLALSNATAERLVAVCRSARWTTAVDGERERERRAGGEDQRCSQGKVEVELEMITEEESRERPAGRAREKPNDHPRLEVPQ